MGYLEAPFAAGFFVVDCSPPRMSCDAEMSDSDSSLSYMEISIDPEVAIVSCYAKPASPYRVAMSGGQSRARHRGVINLGQQI